MSESLKNVAGKRVILGLSGGVDSAVSALLLKQAGADVHALHMTNWEDDDGYCTAADDLQDARRVCDQLGIPLHHVNFAREYRDRVFEYFLDEYRHGRTPNPDVLCNREIKFGVFRDYAKRLGGDLLATGHYARVDHGADTATLLKAKDTNKDQTYFLHAVSGEALAETAFPLGDLDKQQVRDIAHEHGLVVHGKKDSTGICFIGERPFREFLQTYLPASPGRMVTPDGEDVGEHVGLMFYTLGQRQGLGIGGRADAGEEPWYVIAKDLDTNELVVAQGEHEQLFSYALEASATSWIGGEPADLIGRRFGVKVRYRQKDQAATVIASDGDRLTLVFDTPQRAVAPGQFAVIYDGDACLGGAVIDRVIREKPELRDAASA